MADPAHVWRECAVTPTVPPEDKLELGSTSRHVEEQLMHAGFAVGHPIAHEEQVTRTRRVWCNRVIVVRIDGVIDEDRAPRAELRVCPLDGWSATIQQDH